MGVRTQRNSLHTHHGRRSRTPMLKGLLVEEKRELS